MKKNPALKFLSILILIAIACSEGAVPSSSPAIDNQAPTWPLTGSCTVDGETFRGPDGTYVVCQGGIYVTATGTPTMIVPNIGTVPVTTPEGSPVYTPEGNPLPPAAAYAEENGMKIWGFDGVTSWATIFAGASRGTTFFFASTAADATAVSSGLGISVISAEAIGTAALITNAMFVPITGIPILLFAAKYTKVLVYDVTAIAKPEAIPDVDWANLETVLLANTGDHAEAERAKAAAATRQQQCGGRLSKTCDNGNSNGKIEFKAGVNGQTATIAGALVVSTNVIFVWAEAPVYSAGNTVPPGGAVRLLADQYFLESQISIKKVWIMSSKIGNGDMSPYYLNANAGMDKYYQFCAMRNLTIDIATIWLPF